MIKQALNQQDVNKHSPLHIASYFGDFKASRLMVDLGAMPFADVVDKETRKTTEIGTLKISKEKFSRDVLQNLNDAANEGNSKDLQYLVNCGEMIDERIGITGEAPIHKAVLAKVPEDAKEAEMKEAIAKKATTLKTIVECHANLDTPDANGWTALHHAAYTGDKASTEYLLAN